MTPFTTTMTGAVFFSLTAAVNWGSVETVVTVPPLPPVVLQILVSYTKATPHCHVPAIHTRIANSSFLWNTCSLDQVRALYVFQNCWRRGCCCERQQGSKDDRGLHLVYKRMRWAVSLAYKSMTMLWRVIWKAGSFIVIILCLSANVTVNACSLFFIQQTPNVDRRVTDNWLQSLLSITTFPDSFLSTHPLPTELCTNRCST